MTKNKQIAEVIFSKMKELGFEPYNIEYGNGYFLFDYGEDSVVQFRVKGLWKHWQFGMWIFSDYMDKRDEPFVQIFAQYDTQIDKFKPSRSNLLVNLDAIDWTADGSPPSYFWYWEIKQMLNMMCRHPLLCYNGFCGEHAGYANYSFLAAFIKHEGAHYLKLARKHIMTAIYLPYTKLKILLAQKDKCVKSIELYDFEKENPGWQTTYLCEVSIVFNKDVTDDQLNRWFSKWFRKNQYGRFGYYDYVVEVGLFRIDGENKLFSMESSKEGN